MLQKVLISGLLAYLIGAIPTGVVITKLFKKTDLTKFGSGHTGGTNVKRAAGLPAAIITAILDIAWGTLSVWLAWLITRNYWVAAMAGSLAVIGHNWSIYIRMKGGIGLSTIFGGLLFFQPLMVLASVLIILAIRQFLVKILHLHRNRVTIFCMVIFPIILKLLTLQWPAVLLAALGGLAIIIKSIPDWNRVYDEKSA